MGFRLIPCQRGAGVPEATRRAAVGCFRAIVYAGIHPLTGKPRYLKETADSHSAAEQVLTRLQSRVDENRHPKTAITVGEAIARWLAVAKL